MNKSMTILVAGPYRSGTNDIPDLIAKNLERLESYALAVYEKGHIPLIGEWVALPLMKGAGSKQLGDEAYLKYSYPVADRLLEKCDAVLRIDGPSKGADGDVEVAQAHGLRVFRSLDEIEARTDFTSHIARKSS